MAQYKKLYEELVTKQAELEADVTYFKTEAAVQTAHVKELRNRFADIMLQNTQMNTQLGQLQDKIPVSTLETENENLRRINKALGSVDDSDRNGSLLTRLRIFWRYLVVKSKD